MGPRARWLAGLVLCAVVIATVVIDLVLWRRAEPDLGDGAVDQPSWVLVAALASVSLVAFAVLAWRPARTRNLRVPFTVLMLVVTGLAIWPAIWFVEGVPVPAYLLHAPPAAATRQAQQALGEASAGGTCVTVRHDPTHLLPTPCQRCAYLDPGIGAAQVYYQVEGAHQSLFGFIFTPGAPAGGGACVRRIAGDWWAQVATHTVGPSWLQWNLGDAVACPSSFRFIPT